MEVENRQNESHSVTNIIENIKSPVLIDTSFLKVIEDLANKDTIFYKSQQKDESDINKTEKLQILTDTFQKSKANFLWRYGENLTNEQLHLFEQFSDDPIEGYEITHHLKFFQQMHSAKCKHKYVKNKRYAALKSLIEEDSYFTETEMMKRNPLLYEQLVGQYLSLKEKRIRDHKRETPLTFVNVLLDGIEKEQITAKRKKQEELEDSETDEIDSSSDDASDGMKPSSSKISEDKPIYTLWGEMKEGTPKKIKKVKCNQNYISAQERQLLKQEFITYMYQSFLDGKDDDFDYNNVDNNDEYDNIEILTNDEEEKYFDSEEPEINTNSQANETESEDELDIYMNALNQHPIVCHLSEDLKKL